MSIFRRASKRALSPSPSPPPLRLPQPPSSVLLPDGKPQDARPADSAYEPLSCCFEQYRPCAEQRKVSVLAESYEHSVIVHDKWLPQTAFAVNWVCARIEQISRGAVPTATPDGSPPIVLLVGATLSRANQLIAAFYSCVDFARLCKATGYNLAEVYHEGALIRALRLESAENPDVPVLEVHACHAGLSLGYRRNLRALFIDGFGEFVQTPGAIDRCLARFIGRIADDGVSLSVCALVPVYDDDSAALAAALCPSVFADSEMHARLAADACKGVAVAPLSRATVRCLTQALIDEIIIFGVCREVEKAKRAPEKSAQQQQLRRSRSVTFAVTLAGRRPDDSAEIAERFARQKSPRPASAAPAPSAGARLRRTLTRVAGARKMAQMFDSSESDSGSEQERETRPRAPPSPPPPATPCPSFLLALKKTSSV
jgi:hypothetical protein